MNERIAWPDYAKGIAILLVVICHTVNGIHNSDIGGPSPTWEMFNYVSYSFMVPVFFFVSGWFSQQSRRTIPQKISGLFSGVVYPYVVWLTIQGVVLITTKSGHAEATWSDFPAMILTGWMEFWFLHTLVIVSLIQFGLRAAHIPGELRLVVAAVLWAINPWPETLYLNNPARYYIIFELGSYVSTLRWPDTGKISRLSLAAIGAIGLIFFCLQGLGYYSRPELIAALFGIGACLGISSLLPAQGAWTWLRMVGRYSLQIYCAQVICAAAMRSILIHAGIHSFPVHATLGILAGVLIPLAIAVVDERSIGCLFRANFRAPIFGFLWQREVSKP